MYVFQGLKFVCYDKKRRDKKAEIKSQMEETQVTDGAEEGGSHPMHLSIDRTKSINDGEDEVDSQGELLVKVNKQDIMQRNKSVV